MYVAVRVMHYIYHQSSIVCPNKLVLIDMLDALKLLLVIASIFLSEIAAAKVPGFGTKTCELSPLGHGKDDTSQVRESS